MKILISFLLLFLACFESLQAQENDTILPPIDFKKYVEIMTPKMCDSIYRIDTLYYPFEGDVQMIELRFKTVWKKTYCSDSLLNFSKHFCDMPSIFLFRNKKGEVFKIYNNYNNFYIHKEKFRSIEFINTNTYPYDYIIFEIIPDTLLNLIYKNQSEIQGIALYSEINNLSSKITNRKPYINKGLINKKGDIILAAH